MIDWILNYRSTIEILATLTGLLYIILSIRQNILLWPFGIISSLLLVLVNYHADFIANMVLQAFYVVMGFYGWIYWKISLRKQGEEKPLPVRRMSVSTALSYGFVAVILFFIIYRAELYCITHNITDCQNPIWDSVTTTIGIIATWMLIKKYIENWILWIITDIITAGIYLNSKLYPTTILFISFTILAIVGYLEWKKDLRIAVL